MSILRRVLDEVGYGFDQEGHVVQDVLGREDFVLAYVDPLLVLSEGKLTADEVVTCANALEEKMMG